MKFIIQWESPVDQFISAVTIDAVDQDAAEARAYANAAALGREAGKSATVDLYDINSNHLTCCDYIVGDKSPTKKGKS